MKTLKVKIPQGYEIDKEKSTFETIVFKLTKKELPKSWEELGRVNGWFVKSYSKIDNADTDTNESSKNTFATKEQAEASIALAQLSQLREVYRNNWVPDWTDDDTFKYSIEFYRNEINKDTYTTTAQFFSFQDAETRDLFLENFKELIETAKPLMS
jgi:hypothetical protein